MKQFRLFFTLLLLSATIGTYAQFKNFTSSKEQSIRFDRMGHAIDAHDGEIAQFEGMYYLYGTSYDCGYEWGNKTAPFCGFKAYKSKDLINWEDCGFLFDAANPLWQSRCNGTTYGCYRPHVVFNAKTKKYVLWVNVYDNRVGYRVFTSDKPAGPFLEVAEPKLAVNSDMPEKGLNNGDHDLFIDDDGTCYLAYTDWRAKGAIAVEKLDPDYLTGTGEVAKAVTEKNTEAPGMFKRNGIYYITYSDPNCGYCSGTGTSYKSAKKPLGPWSESIKISENSCGGQPSFVSTVKINEEVVFIYGSDLWNNAAKNEALANFYWAPLEFEKDGKIKALRCFEAFEKLKVKTKEKPVDRPSEYSWKCGITDSTSIQKIFIANSEKAEFDLLTFKNAYPTAPLKAELYTSPDNKIASIELSAELGWSPSKEQLKFNTSLKIGERYSLVLTTTSKQGCYGIAKDPAGNILISQKQ